MSHETHTEDMPVVGLEKSTDPAPKPGPRPTATASPRPRPTTAAAPGTKDARRVTTATVVAGALALVLFAAAVLFAILYLNARGTANDRMDAARALSADRKQALTAAETLSVDISTYDYRTLDENFDRVANQLSSTFAKEYRNTSAALRSTITQYQGVATARALEAGLVRLSGKKAVVVVFLDQTITNKQSKTPTVSRNRIEVKLDKMGKRWTVTSLSLR